MHLVYILYSEKLQRFYIGETHDMQQRLRYHNSFHLNTNSTKNGIPWTIYLTLQVENRAIARKIEKHIKNMKSKTYINNLKRYNEIRDKLIAKFSK